MCRASKSEYSVYKTAALPLCYTGRRPETVDEIGGFRASEALLTTFEGASSRHVTWHIPFWTRSPFPSERRTSRPPSEFLGVGTKIRTKRSGKMPCVYRRGKTWWGRFTLDGQEHRRSLRTLDERQAKALLLNWIAETSAARPANSSGLDVWTAAGVLGQVYALGYADRVKIGWTGVNPNWRRLNLQRSYPETLVLFGASPGYMNDEKALHAQFAERRIRGEWFLREGPVAAWIEAGCPARFETTVPS